LGRSPSAAVHSRDAAAERSRVAVVQPLVAGADSPVVGVPLPAAVDEFRGEGARSLDESDSAREMKPVDGHSGGLADSPLAAAKLTGGNP
jgi:hypothetical protein